MSKHKHIVQFEPADFALEDGPYVYTIYNAANADEAVELAVEHLITDLRPEEFGIKFTATVDPVQ